MDYLRMTVAKVLLFVLFLVKLDHQGFEGVRRLLRSQAALAACCGDLRSLVKYHLFRGTGLHSTQLWGCLLLEL